MNETTAPLTGDVAQPVADVTVESILNQSAVKPIEETPTEPPAEEPAEEPKEEAKEETKRELTAEEKKLENALSYRKKQEARYRKEAETNRQENERLTKELAQYKPKETPKDDGAPKEADYKTYAEYLEARQDWKLDQRLKAQDEKQTEVRQSDEDRRFFEERGAYADKIAKETIKANPEIKQVIDDYADVLDRLHPSLTKLLLQADNPTLTAHHLAKEGVLDNLASMSLEDARVEFRLAQKMQTPPQKQQTKAPAPLPAARGSVPASTPLDKLSALEAHKLLSQKD